jgi:biotin-(acetyl-CoA carboxylase) ligase
VGIAAGIDGDGRLVVRTEDGEVRLDAGEVHLGSA